MDTADPNKLADDIIDIAKLFASYGVKDVIVSSVLIKRNISLTRIIRTKGPVENKMSTK